MRVIAGIYKGRFLQSVPGHVTRPTADKVKEALFHRIGPFFHGGWGLDLYSGSGALGIEALSRGLDHMIFVDHHIQAVKIIRKNIAVCGLEKQSEIFKNDAGRALKAIHKRDLTFKLILLDPPYFQHQLAWILEKIELYDLLEAEGILVVEHHEKTRLAHTVGTLCLDGAETYSSGTVVSIFRKNKTAL